VVRNWLNIKSVNGSLDFRKDIQGLRGIAVGLVVLEHATPVISGGYIGVDVFFVISGFVITQLLLREMQSRGSISLVTFYSRRVRRLVPALVIVLTFSLVGSVLVLSPGLEQDKTVSAALASLFFVANLRYILEGGYFFLQADPFRHLWSLGVEEQFYFFYPILIVGLVRFSRERRMQFANLSLIVLGVLTAASFISASLLAEGYRLLPLPTRMSFFGTPFRLWELMAGGILAFALFDRKIKFGLMTQILGWSAGLALILFPAFTYDSFTVFPGVAALAPVVGTLILIWAGSSYAAAAGPLSWKPLTYIGDISYGLYLWHWPLIVYSERLFPGNSLAILIAVVISLGASAVQWRLVEIRFRNKSDVIGRKALKFFGFAATSLVVLSITVFALSRTGLGLDLRAQFEPMPRASDGCSFETRTTAAGSNCSDEGRGPVRMILVGDSQAGALADAFVLVAKELEASYKVVYGNSCPVHARPNELRDSCSDQNKELAGIVRAFRPSIIVVANASDLYVTRGGFGKPDARIRRADGSIPRNYGEALENWVSGVREVLESDWRENTPLLYVQMIPVAPTQTESLLRRRQQRSTFLIDEGFDRNVVTAAERIELSGLSEITVLDPAEVLCPDNRCLLSINGKSLYSDAYHLNPRGAKLLVPRILDSILAMIGN